MPATSRSGEAGTSALGHRSGRLALEVEHVPAAVRPEHLAEVVVAVGPDGGGPAAGSQPLERGRSGRRRPAPGGHGRSSPPPWWRCRRRARRARPPGPGAARRSARPARPMPKRSPSRPRRRAATHPSIPAGTVGRRRGRLPRPRSPGAPASPLPAGLPRAVRPWVGRPRAARAAIRRRFDVDARPAARAPLGSRPPRDGARPRRRGWERTTAGAGP